MSVINEMLQDLEQRKGVVLGSNASVVAPDRHGLKIILSVVFVGLFTAVAFWAMGVISLPVTNSIPSPLTGQADSSVIEVVRTQGVDEPKAKPSPPSMVVAQDSPGSEVLIAKVEAVEPEMEDEPTKVIEPEVGDEPTIVDAPIQAEVSRVPVIEVVTAQPSVVTRLSKEPNSVPSNATTLTQQTVEKVPTFVPAASTVQTSTPKEDLDSGEMQVTLLELTVAERAQVYREQAKQAMSKGNPTKARQAFTKVLSLEPGSVADRIQLATLYYAQDEVNRAIALLEKGVALTPEVPQLRLAMARIYTSQEDIDQAWYYLDALAPDVAEHIDYIAAYAGLAQRRGDNLTAEKTYLSLVRVQSEVGRWWLGLAIAQDKLGEYAKATLAYQKALSCNLSNALSQFARNRMKELEQ